MKMAAEAPGLGGFMIKDMDGHMAAPLAQGRFQCLEYPRGVGVAQPETVLDDMQDSDCRRAGLAGLCAPALALRGRAAGFWLGWTRMRFASLDAGIALLVQVAADLV